MNTNVKLLLPEVLATVLTVENWPQIIELVLTETSVWNGDFVIKFVRTPKEVISVLVHQVIL